MEIKFDTKKNRRLFCVDRSEEFMNFLESKDLLDMLPDEVIERFIFRNETSYDDFLTDMKHEYKMDLFNTHENE